jgi:hypothetical protein
MFAVSELCMHVLYVSSVNMPELCCRDSSFTQVGLTYMARAIIVNVKRLELDGRIMRYNNYSNELRKKTFMAVDRLMNYVVF